MATKKKTAARKKNKGLDVTQGAEDMTEQGCLYCGRDKGLLLHVTKFQPSDCKASALLIYYDCQYCRAKAKREAVKAAKQAEEAGL